MIRYDHLSGLSICLQMIVEVFIFVYFLLVVGGCWLRSCSIMTVVYSKTLLYRPLTVTGLIIELNWSVKLKKVCFIQIINLLIFQKNINTYSSRLYNAILFQLSSYAVSFSFVSYLLF